MASKGKFFIDIIFVRLCRTNIKVTLAKNDVSGARRRGVFRFFEGWRRRYWDSIDIVEELSADALWVLSVSFAEGLGSSTLRYGEPYSAAGGVWSRRDRRDILHRILQAR